jgi:hypothetical protein
MGGSAKKSAALFTFAAHILFAHAQGLLAQSSASLADHVVWERDFSQLNVSVTGAAVADSQGNLWAVSDFRESKRLVRISADGELRLNTELPAELKPALPATTAMFKLAASKSGPVALLARYMHYVQRTVYFDGAKFSTIDGGGTFGPMRSVAGPGPEYKEFVALNDEHFLAIGDQSPMTIVRINREGAVDWRRTFPASWVLPSGAALEDGSSCIVTPIYASPQLHLIWVDKKGVTRHQEWLAGRWSVAAGSGSACAFLLDRAPSLQHSQFFLTGYDGQFKRSWTVSVLDPAPPGTSYAIAALSDGYVVSIGVRDGLFLAKYSFAGKLVWSVMDAARNQADLIIGAGDSFFVVGADSKGHYTGLHVIRAR